MAVNIVQAILTAKDEISGTIKKASKRSEKSMKGLEASVWGVHKSFNRLGALLISGFAARGIKAAVRGTTDLSKRLITLGAETDAITRSYEGLTQQFGLFGDEMLGAVAEGSRDMISNTSAMQEINRALLLGLPVTTEKMGELAQVSRILGQAMGRTANEGMADLILGFGRGSAKILDNLGIIVDANEAHEEFALSIGKTVKQLSDAERKTAVFNVGMERALEVVSALDGPTDSLSEVVQQLATSWENLQQRVGDLVADSPDLREMLRNITDFIDSISGEDINNAISNIKGLFDQISRIEKLSALTNPFKFFEGIKESIAEVGEADLSVFADLGEKLREGISNALFELGRDDQSGEIEQAFNNLMKNSFEGLGTNQATLDSLKKTIGELYATATASIDPSNIQTSDFDTFFTETLGVPLEQFESKLAEVRAKLTSTTIVLSERQRVHLTSMVESLESALSQSQIRFKINLKDTTAEVERVSEATSGMFGGLDAGISVFAGTTSAMMRMIEQADALVQVYTEMNPLIFETAVNTRQLGKEAADHAAQAELAHEAEQKRAAAIANIQKWSQVASTAVGIFVQDEKRKAQLEGLIEIARAYASYPDAAGISAHLLASAAYFKAAGDAGGGARGGVGGGRASGGQSNFDPFSAPPGFSGGDNSNGTTINVNIDENGWNASVGQTAINAVGKNISEGGFVKTVLDFEGQY